MARKKSAAANLRKRNLQRIESAVVREKGMELPVNTLVVVAIAVIVILAIAVFFMGGFGGSSKDMQNRQAFLNSCSGWAQTACGDSDIPSDLKELYMIWQPKVDFSDSNNVGGSGLSTTDYLKKQCGCFGTGTPNPTGRLCREFTADTCPSDRCEKETNCETLGFACEDNSQSTGVQCPTGKIEVSYAKPSCNVGLTTPTKTCCKASTAPEPTNACRSK